MRISYSKVELYNTCPAKYKYRYVDKLEANKTFTPLLFGSAIDRALNYVLTRTKHKHHVSLIVAESLFLDNMKQWTGQNELIYFKNEMPDLVDEQLTPEQVQLEVWNHLCKVGGMMLQTYVTHILTEFKEICSVQTKQIINNEVGDEFVLVTDFSAILQDGRKVLIDNKTSSDIKKAYPKNSVKNSTQLSLYSEYEDTKLCGYIALQKKLVDDRVIWKLVIDEPSEETATKSFERIDSTLRSIKREEFPKNEKSCYLYGKPCEYYKYCKFGSKKDLKK